MRRRRRLAFLPLLALAVAALTIGAPASTLARDASSPEQMAQRLLMTPLPSRAPFELALRLRNLSELSVGTPVPTPGPPSSVGGTDTFWILDQRRATLFQTSATVRFVTDHAYWYVEDDLTDHVDLAELQRAAHAFEDVTYPLVTRYFGEPQIDSTSGDAHIVMLLANVPGVAAYFSSADAYPRWVNPRSNERPMMYINVNALRSGNGAFDATLAHELQHMANFSRCPGQEGWVDEGASELAMRVAGYEGTSPAAFGAHPHTQLTAWTNQPNEVIRHYGAAYLFLRYVTDRAGGPDVLPDLFGTCARGEDLFAAFLAQHPLAPGMEGLFSDWTVANLVADPSVADGRFAYASAGLKVALAGSVTRDAPFYGSLPPYATDYLDIASDLGALSFVGDPTVPVFAGRVDEAGAWWSNRADAIDARLTRRLDLRGLTSASLHFQAWYDLEDRFDFVYLSVSRDDGQTWQIVPGLLTQPDSDTGNNFGEGWTGSSGGAWVDENVDLSAWAGQQVRVRFDYITDQGYTGQGFALKDLAIPEQGLAEMGAGLARAWEPDGWVRVDAGLPERWNVRLVRWTPDGTFVDAVEVGPDGRARVELDPSATRQVLVVAPTALRTIVPSDYTVSGL